MKEESKEEFLARHRKSLGDIEEEEDLETDQGISFITTIKNFLYFILLLAFVWIIYQMFGMMKSN